MPAVDGLSSAENLAAKVVSGSLHVFHNHSYWHGQLHRNGMNASSCTLVELRLLQNGGRVMVPVNSSGFQVDKPSGGIKVWFGKLWGYIARLPLGRKNSKGEGAWERGYRWGVVCDLNVLQGCAYDVNLRADRAQRP